MKQKLAELPTLSLPDSSNIIQIEFDASGSAIGAILSQGGRYLPFFSDKFNNTKKKYSVYDEFYGIVQNFKKW